MDYKTAFYLIIVHHHSFLATMLNDTSQSEIESLQNAANDACGLALDAIASANSGHLGMPLGCSKIGAALFGKLLRLNPQKPTWINRDRFVLSAGHGSMFLYAWLHFSGYDISLEDIKNFRKTGSKTAGHPEFNQNIEIECTTGPLGQGVANAVGMAVSCKKLAAIFNTDDQKIIDNNIVCLCGDGCLQEGVAIEACSIAGHWKLDNLIIILDANDVTLDGNLSKSQSENVAKKYEAMGFEVFEANGNDILNFITTYNSAKFSKKNCPKLLITKTVIGRGIPDVEGTNKAHGAYGTKFLQETKKALGLPDKEFYVSTTTKEFFKNRQHAWQDEFKKWEKTFLRWEEKNPDLAKQLDEIETHKYIEYNKIPTSEKEKISTRAASGEILNIISDENKFIVSGSADLFSSNCNYIKDCGDFSDKNPLGRNLFFGIREHAMAAISNGISYDGKFLPVCATFLAFSDYMRGAIRVAALAKIRTIFILTHDSIAVGEDGPTHQPVEIVSSLRCVPNLDVVRPATYEETVGAWELAIENHNRPTALILSRQDLPKIDEIPAKTQREGTLKGAYIALHEKGKLEAIIIASGSELHIAINVANVLHGVRVVSMPCMEAFDRQLDSYKNSVLPPFCKKRISIEAGIAQPWYKHIGSDGIAVSVENFGFSGQPKDLMDHFGITEKNLQNIVTKMLD